jgi:hypothetical protein
MISGIFVNIFHGNYGKLLVIHGLRLVFYSLFSIG